MITIPAAAKLLGECAQAVRDVLRHPDDVMRGFFVPVIADGHGLVHGDIGFAKTMTVQAVSRTLALSFGRIDATPDLFPGDIVGSEILRGGEVVFKKGPALRFQLLVIDEINRANPKSQSASLQTMEERAYWRAGERHECQVPFVVYATQNPREHAGVFPLPEAQLDRFIVRVDVRFPDDEACRSIAEDLGTARLVTKKVDAITPVLDAATLDEIREVVRDVPLGKYTKWIIDFCRATRPDGGAKGNVPDITEEFVEHGAGPRGIRDMSQTARALAVMDGKANVEPKVLKEAAYLSLRHRVSLNRAGRRNYGGSVDAYLDDMLGAMPPS